MSKKQLPEGWTTATIAELATALGRGKSPKYAAKDTGYYAINQKCLYWDEIKLENRKPVSKEWFNGLRQDVKARSGDVLINSTGTGTLGRVCVWRDESGSGVPDSHVTTLRLKAGVDPKFVCLYFKTEDGRKIIDNATTGSTNQIELNKSKLSLSELPLPPAAEQKRIVTKVELAQEKIKSIESAAASAEILIEKCRESLLQMAFRGHLGPQDVGDEPASILIERLRSERDSQPESKKKKKEELPPISPDEIPFEIPSSWAWVRLGEISEKIGSGQTPKGGNSVYKKTGVPLIRSQNVLNGHLDLTDVAYIDKATDQDMRGSRVYAGDVLYNITGGSIGRSCVTPADFNGGNVNQHVLSIRPMIKGLYMSTYISEYLLSPYGKDFIFKNKKGAARDAITKKQIENLVIPLPPLKEIDRIIRKIQKSYDHIHTFKQRTKTLKVAGNSLANSILSSAFLGKLVPQISSEGTGHILLEEISSQVENQNNN